MSALTLIALIVTGGCEPLDPHPPAEDLAGNYERLHGVWVFHGSEPVEVEVADRLELTVGEGGSLGFLLQVFAVNGRECQLEGVAQSRSGGFVYSEGATGNTCSLSFEAHDRRVLVTDSQSGCGVAHCGDPGAMDRLSFRLVEEE